MKIYQFKIELLSDIILSQKAASKGNQETLDFIPGSNFLGIVASSYKEFENSEQISVFHSSKFKFGDAHPLCDNKRALRTPASFHFPKNKSIKDAYIHHKIKDYKIFTDLQLKQSRAGYYVFKNSIVNEIKIDKNFAIKSAYDREKRRSEDKKMYGYESMQEGTTFCFELTVDSDVSQGLIDKVVSKLEGKKRVGRSRTAQYGLVEIRQESYDQVKSNQISDSEVVIYAESRLIFLDEFNNPTLQPKVTDFGLSGGEIDWQKSQIRVFSYSPYNYKRQSFDSGRIGIEKGSVFVVEDAKVDEIKEFVGSYQNEGFGKVIVNPSFFEADENAKSKLQFGELGLSEKGKPNSVELIKNSDKTVFSYLVQQKGRDELKKEIYHKVNKFVSDNADKFKGNQFASQWGTIRSLAMQYSTKAKLEEELFTKTVMRDGKKLNFAYLTHGIAAQKWNERSRRKVLEEFFNSVDKDMIQYAMINLASEMAKKCGR